MPLVTTVLSNSIVAAGAGLGIAGTDFPKIASAVASTAKTVFTQPATVTVTASGAAGSGTISPKAMIKGVTSGAIALAINSSMAAQGLTGEKSYNMATAIAKGVSVSLKSLILTGTCPGVGAGTGTGKIINFNNVLFSNTLYMHMVSKGLAGKDTMALAKSIGDGICNTINATGLLPLVTIVGAAGTVSGAAVFPAKFA